MNSPLISLIIPVFNAEKFLERCIHSVLGQTLTDIEVIAVNDGSEDASAVILDRLALMDRRLRVYHRENHGVSSSRNFGLRKAEGKFIGFVDSDDWLEADMMAQMYKSAVDTESDIVVCNVRIHEGSDVRKRLNINTQSIEVATERADILRRFMRFEFDYANWNKLYRASLVRQNDIRFVEKMCLWEDLLFNLMFLHSCLRMEVIDRELYHYRVQKDSITSMRKSDLVVQFNFLFRAYFDFAVSRGATEELQVFKFEMARVCYHDLLFKLSEASLSRSKSYLGFLKEHYTQLKAIDPGVFVFPNEEYRGIQGVKKWLLTNRLFFIFSIVDGTWVYLRSRKLRD